MQIWMKNKTSEVSVEEIRSDDDHVQADTNNSLLDGTGDPKSEAASGRIDTGFTDFANDISVDIKTDMKSNSNWTKFSVYKNLIVITVSFLCLFTAYSSLEMLQSSLNVAGGLGLIGLTVVYSSKLLSSLFLPSFVFSKLGMKWTIVVATFGYIAFAAASFHATWGTLIPASVLLGIGASNLWTGQMSYVSTLAERYATITGIKLSNALSRIFSIFYVVFHTGEVWGNMVSSLVFSYEKSDNATESNFTCGVNFCPQSSSTNPNLIVTDPIKIYTYLGFCLVSSAIATLLMALCLDNIRPAQPLNRSASKLFTAVVRQFKTSGYQKLLIPTTLYRGLSQGFIAADFNAGFTSCYLGVENVGFIMICCALSCSLGALLFGKISRWAGFHIPYIIAFILHISASMVLFLWQPVVDQKYVFFILASLWAFGYSVYSSTLAPIYSQVFPGRTTEAMSCFDLLGSLGCVLSYGLSSFLCIAVKLGIVVTFSFISTACVLIIFLHHKHTCKKARQAH